MNTPVFDFINQYKNEKFSRLHMPGHKGKSNSLCEEFDITEIDGADVLYHESGILAESQRNASKLFGSQKTIYSAEGATLAIRAMLALTVQYAKELGKDAVIAAGRNAHKSFLTSCALLDLDPLWLQNDESANLFSFSLDAASLATYFENASPLPFAIYLTTPDYLGNVLDIKNIAKVCKRYGVLLLVDNAHGAYLQFLPESMHPLSLGADLCCDSAHKTLPVLTGGAYLHIAKDAPSFFGEHAESAISIFASTSPSYLILSSLDRCNAYLDRDFRLELTPLCEKIEALKKSLKQYGFVLTGSEPLKITVLPKFSGYTGDEIAEKMRKAKLECEFSDPDHVVMMFSTANSDSDLEKVVSFFKNLPIQNTILEFPPKIRNGRKAINIRSALLSPSEQISVENAVGRILADPSITCPPAIPIGICGEEILESTVQAFLYYGMKYIRVLK